MFACCPVSRLTIGAGSFLPLSLTTLTLENFLYWLLKTLSKPSLSEEGTRRWQGYKQRKVEFCFPPVTRVADSQLSHLKLYYSTKLRVRTFGTEPKVDWWCINSVRLSIGDCIVFGLVMAHNTRPNILGIIFPLFWQHRVLGAHIILGVFA